MRVLDIVLLTLGMYGAVMSTVIFFRGKNKGKITNDGVVAPNGEQIIKKQTR